MNESIIEDKIFIALEFNEEWIKIGIITIDNFASLKEEYIKQEDSNTEHYRWGAFNTFLKNNEFLSEEKFYRLYKLAKNDPDPAMGTAMLFDIIKHKHCPLELIEAAVNDSDLILVRGAFNIFFKSKNFPEEKFHRLYKLAKNDPNPGIGITLLFDLIKHKDCPLELIEAAINDSNLTLVKHALKCKAIRERE